MAIFFATQSLLVFKFIDYVDAMKIYLYTLQERIYNLLPQTRN